MADGEPLHRAAGGVDYRDRVILSGPVDAGDDLVGLHRQQSISRDGFRDRQHGLFATSWELRQTRLSVSGRGTRSLTGKALAAHSPVDDQHDPNCHRRRNSHARTSHIERKRAGARGTLDTSTTAYRTSPNRRQGGQ